MDYEDVHGFDGEAMLDQIREDYPRCDSGTKQHVYEFVLSQVEKFAQLLHLQGHINETYEQYVQSNEMLTDDSFIDKYFKAAALNLSELKAALLATCMKTLLKSKSTQSKAKEQAKPTAEQAKPTAKQAQPTAQPTAKQAEQAKPTAKQAEQAEQAELKAEVESDEEADCIFDDSDSDEEEEEEIKNLTSTDREKTLEYRQELDGNKKRKAEGEADGEAEGEAEGTESNNKRQKNVVSKSVYNAWRESVKENVKEYLDAYEEAGQYWATEDLVNALLDGFGTNSDAEFDALAAFLTKKLCGLFDEKSSDKPSPMKKGRDGELEDFLIGLIDYMPFEDF